MDPRDLYDRAVFDRWYDGLAARNDVNPKYVAWLAYRLGAGIPSNTGHAEPLDREVRVDIYHLTDERDVLISRVECPWRTMVDTDEVMHSYAIIDGQRLKVPQTDADLKKYFEAEKAEAVHD